MVGYKPQDGDDVAIIEDVVTAGHRRAGVHRALQARGRREHEGPSLSAWTGWSGAPGSAPPWTSCARDYGIQVFPIVTVREVISFLHNNPIDGKVYIDRRHEGQDGGLYGGVRSQGLSHKIPRPSRRAEGGLRGELVPPGKRGARTRRAVPTQGPPAFWMEAYLEKYGPRADISKIGTERSVISPSGILFLL